MIPRRAHPVGKPHVRLNPSHARCDRDRWLAMQEFSGAALVGYGATPRLAALDLTEAKRFFRVRENPPPQF